MIEIFVLSLVQGVTEFLPVSSSSHLIIISEYLEFNNNNLLKDLKFFLYQNFTKKIRNKYAN